MATNERGHTMADEDDNTTKASDDDTATGGIGSDETDKSGTGNKVVDGLLGN